MTQSRPKSTVSPAPTTPPPHSSPSMTLSPPLSPSSSLPIPSDDEFPSDLSESWLEIEERSSVGPSVLGDIVFSDTSSDTHSTDHETRSQWSASSDGGRDADVEDAAAVILESSHEDIGSPSLTGYTDAEASTSKLDSSMDTLHMSSDQIRLVFPDGASFTTSSSGTLSAGFTPSASISGLTPMPQPDQAPRSRAGTTIEPAVSPIIAVGKMSPRRSSSPVRRGVEDSWLRSSKLWALQKEETNNDYHLLQSTDDLQRVEEEVDSRKVEGDLQMPTLNDFDEMFGREYPAKNSNTNFRPDEAVINETRFPVNETDDGLKENLIEQIENQHIITCNEAEAVKTLVRKWSSRVSYFALASIFSVAFIRYFGSDLFVPFTDQGAEVTTTVIPTETPKSASFWDHLPFASPASISSVYSASTPSGTAVQPDPRLVQRALRTSSGKSSSSASASSSLESAVENRSAVAKTRDLGSRHSTSCCSLSVINNNVALTVPPSSSPADSNVSMARRITRKLLRANKTDSTDTNTSTPVVHTLAANCSCSVSTLVQSEILQRLAQALGPIMLAFEKEYEVLYGSVVHLAHSSYNVSYTALHRAAIGAVVAKNSVDSALQKCQNLISNFYSSHTPSVKDDHTSRASDLLDTLSDYVETQLDMLSDSIEEQAENIHHEAWAKIYKARSGLERIIQEAKRLRGVEVDSKIKSTDVEKDGPLPFSHMGTRSSAHIKAARDGHKKTRRGTGRRERRREKKLAQKELRGKKVKINTVPKSIPPMEKPSKGKKFMDMIHHGALALVV